MSESNAPHTHAPLDPALFPSTAVWNQPPPPPGPSQGPTQAAASTPGPNDPGRGTHTDSTEPMGEPVAGLPRLPPIPGYRVERFVGRGGMGIVYQAVHLATGRTVALKVIAPGGNDYVTRERFTREIHALAALKHPNIVPVYDAGDWHGFPYCVMEFVPGGTLAGHLDRIRGDLRASVQLMAKVARAVAALHAAGVVHRDLKPLNVLLGADDEPMVADFGLARWAGEDSDLTRTGLPVGTKVYMAPEQTYGRREDYAPACDVWGLGVMLYEVLTGERPFCEDGVTDVHHRIRHDDPPPIATHAPAVPPELEAVARKCLEKRPEDRYASAALVAADLERWLAGEPLSVTPAPAAAVPVPLISAPVRERTRRAPLLLAALGALLLAAAVAGLGGAFRAPASPRTLAQRVAAGEKVQLTDDQGQPTVPTTSPPGYPLGPKDIHDYKGLSSKNAGMLALADEPWELPIRIEAEVAVDHETPVPAARAGVYVGRKVWPGLDFPHESLVWFGVSPQDEKDGSALLTEAVLYWWDRDQFGSDNPLVRKPAPPDPAAEKAKMRFARVVIEVREKELRGTVAGIEVPAISEQSALDRLNFISSKRPYLQGYRFAEPAFGTGIGVFCDNANCVVRNLTVSKLTP